MQSIPLIILILGTIAIVIVLFVVQFIYNSKLKTNLDALKNQLESNELVIDEFKLTLINQQKSYDKNKKQLEVWQLEHQQISQQLEHRIKLLQEKVVNQQGLIEQNQSQQPEDKLYSRAQKMVMLGADVAELVAECDLPTAEAEMLVALHNRK